MARTGNNSDEILQFLDSKICKTVSLMRDKGFLQIRELMGCSETFEVTFLFSISEDNRLQ